MDKLQILQRDFVNLRLGTFVHFNSATVQFQEGPTVDWEYACENDRQPRKYPFSPGLWNPDGLDCRQWAAAAKAAGFRFAALTAKHHEGFALWPTAWSDHCVKNAANTTDVVAEFLKAFREAGIAAGLYFSILDLTQGIGRNCCTPAQKEYIKGQITELLTQYGPIPFLITDGWAAPWGGPGYDALPFEELDALVKSLQPHCLLMNIGCSEGLEGTDVVFFENAAGQEAAKTFSGPGVSCNKLTQSWFWRTTDTGDTLRDAGWAHAKAEVCFSMNCCFMLNLSPNPHGRIDQNLMDAFSEIGKTISFPKPLTELPEGWLQRNPQNETEEHRK